MKMNWKRARSEEQKEQRISEIVRATARLYKKFEYEKITLALIAKEAKFTRSNIYKYFSSKEEVFLELLKYDLNDLLDDVHSVFDEGRDYSFEEFAGLWTAALMRHQRMIRLFSLSGALLEKNCSDEALIDYKRAAMSVLSRITGLVTRAFPEMPKEAVIDFIAIQLGLACGLYPMSTALTERQKKLIEKSDVEHFEMDFENYFRKAVEALLKGLEDIHK